MLKNFSLLIAIASFITSTAGYLTIASAEPPSRPINQVKGTSPQEQQLLDALAKTPGYTPSVGRYVQEFKRVHAGNLTQAQHQANQQALVSKYPNEARFFQAFLQRIANMQQQRKSQLVIQAIQRDGKLTTRFKQFLNELSTAVRTAKTVQEAKANQQRVINKYPQEAKLVVQYSNKLK
jgi:hypothetical protein